MGVKGLWTLLGPVGRPVLLETMEGKVLAIDSSIWIYQFQATMRDKEGRGLVNAHVLGFLRRICKLLYYGIKPVFVFDGGAPALKRVTINERKNRKRGAAASHAKLAEQLLAAQMRKEALSHMAASTSNVRPTNATASEGGSLLGENTVYLEDYDAPNAPRPPATPNVSEEKRRAEQAEAETSAKRKREKYANMDPYALPAVDVEAALAVKANAARPDPRLATEDEMRAFIDEMRPDDFDVTSPEFRELPTEVQYEIIGDLRLRSRQTSYKRLESMLRSSRTSLDFSRAQIQNLKERNSLTQQLLLTAEGVGKVIDHHLTIPVRVASERNREYVLIKNEGADGGWVLGMRDLGTKDAPIVIDSGKDENGSDEEDAEMDDAGAPYDPEYREHMRAQALSALAERYTPKKPARVAPEPSHTIPSLGPAPQPGSQPLFALDEVAEADDPDLDEWAEDEDLALALEMSIDSAPQDADNPFLVSSTQATLASTSAAIDDDSEDEDMEPVPIESPELAPERASSAAPVIDLDDFESPSPTPSPSPPPVSRSKQQTPAEKAGSSITHASAFVHDTFKSHPLLSDSASSRVLSPFSGKSPTRPIISPIASGSKATVSPSISNPITPTRSSSSPARRPSLPVTQSQPVLPVRRAGGSSSPFDDASDSAAPIFRAHSRPTARQPIPVGSLPTSGASRIPLSKNLTKEPDALPQNASSPMVIDKGKGPELRRAISREIFSFPDEAFEQTPEPVAPSPVLARSARPSPARRPSLSRADLRRQSSNLSRASMPLDREELESDTSPSPALSRSSSAKPPHVRVPSPVQGVSTPQTISRKQSSSSMAIDSAPAEETDEPSEARISDEEDDDIPWSRSPSPTGRPAADSQQPPEDWDAAQEMDPEAEENEFAQFMSHVKGKDINAMQREIDEEISSLNKQRKAALVASEDITSQMVTQIQNMLRLFGIPYITAPMEAEAQCAELVSLGLVEGIITDDSDVFLFGGLRVFKNMFNQSKTVECFLLSDLGRELSLDRDKLIRLAYLLGSDYVDGLPKVGPVVAMELLKDFSGEDGLHKFKDWWTKVQSGRDKPADIATPFRRKFKRRYKDLYLPSEWPNSNVRDAYYHPTVDESAEPFKWGLPDLDALREFLHEELGWNANKVDETLLPIIRKVGQRGKAAQANKQGTLNSFFDVSVGTGSYEPRKRQAYSSKRLQKVVSDFRKEQIRMEEVRRSLAPEEGEEEVEPPKKGKRKAKAASGEETAPKRKTNGKGRASSVASSADPVVMQSPESGTPAPGGTPATATPKSRPKPRRITKGGDDEYVPGKR